MHSELRPWTPHRLFAAMALIGLTLVFGYLTLESVFSAPDLGSSHGPDSRDFMFYYRNTYFKRSPKDVVFSNVTLGRDTSGPWLWLSKTKGFKVERENAVEIGKQIAQQLGLNEPQMYDHVLYVEGGSWSLRLVTADNRNERESDGWIDAGRDAIPITISMTEDGPRISFPCTEKELRKAFGEPIIRRSDLPNAPQGAPGV